VKHISDEVAVMYLGHIVERATRDDLFAAPLHPYTRMLFSAVPDMSRPFLDQEQIKGEVPNPTNLPSGCLFHPRCPMKRERCERDHPGLEDAGGNHWVRCFYYQEGRHESLV
jgi:oligopeptide/dipeptide ABC transporter ATP-binding protein